MKEVLTKRFWESVKKTFDDGLEGRPPADNTVQTKADDGLSASSTSEIQPSTSVSSERN
jgi:hypothetical protein